MTEIHKVCSFFGHSQIEITDELKVKLKNLLIDLIEKQNANIFYFGGFGQFDDLCYKTVCELKQTYTDLQRIFCTADPRWLRPSKRPRWLNEEEYEDIVYLDLDFDRWYQRIYFRNCEMMNQSDFVVFYVKDKSSRSGAYKALQYATKKKKQYFNLAEQI